MRGGTALLIGANSTQALVKGVWFENYLSNYAIDIEVSTGSASFLAGIGVVDDGFSIILSNSAEGSAIFFPKFISLDINNFYSIVNIYAIYLHIFRLLRPFLAIFSPFKIKATTFLESSHTLFLKKIGRAHV